MHAETRVSSFLLRCCIWSCLSLLFSDRISSEHFLGFELLVRLVDLADVDDGERIALAVLEGQTRRGRVRECGGLQ